MTNNNPNDLRSFSITPYSSYIPQIPTFSPAPVTPAPTPPIVVGIEPQAYEAVLYGKARPLFVGGMAEMGGRIVEGPFYPPREDGEKTFDAIYCLAEAANPTGTRDITEVSIRGASTPIDGSGYLTGAQYAPFGTRVQFRTGTRTQTAFDRSIGRYGSGAIAYRQDILISVTDMPMRPSNGIIPYISGLIEDSSFGDPADGITRQDAVEVLLRYARLDDTEFDVSLPGSDIAWIVANKSTLLEFLQNLRRIFVHWNITYTDKMRIVDPTNFTINTEITRSNHIRASMQLSKTDPLIVPRRVNYSFIDIDRDYETNVATASEDIYPAPSLSSVDEVSVDLPIVTTSSQATADVNVSLYEQLAVRSQIEATLMPSLFATEPGDAARFMDHDDINSTFRVMETSHDFATWQVGIKAGEVLNCGAGVEACLMTATQMAVASDANVVPQCMLIDNGYLYVAPCFNAAFGSGTGSPVLTRYPLSNFAAPQTLTIPLIGPPGNSPEIWSMTSDGTYLYLYPRGDSATSGGTTTVKSVLRRVLISDFATVNTLNLFPTTGNIQPPTSPNASGKIVALGSWLYLMNVQGGGVSVPNGGSATTIARVSTSDFTTIETLTIGSLTISGYDVFTDGSFIYMVGFHDDGPPTPHTTPGSTDLIKIDPSTFTVVASLTIAAQRGIAFGCAAGGYAYISPLYSTFPTLDDDTVFRVNLGDFATIETRVLDYPFGNGVADIFAVGDKVYLLEGTDGSSTAIVGIDTTAATWSTAPVCFTTLADLAPSITTTGNKGFSAVTTDGNYIYATLGYNYSTVVRLTLFT